MAVTRSVPVIDMQDFSTLPQKMVNACEEWGCFRLKNHGIPLSLMYDMKDVARSLHDLPKEIKMPNYNHQEPSKGYTPTNMVSAVFESLSLYDMESAASVDHFCTQLDASRHQSLFLVDSDHPALYAPFNFLQYRNLRTSMNAPTGEALQFFRSHPDLLN